MYNNLENEILNMALDTFKKNIDLPINIEIKEFELTNNIIFDKLLKIKVQGIDIFFCVEIKTTINKATMGFLLQQRDKLPHQQLLIAKYITTYMAEELRKNGIQFIDTAGNTYINHFPIYIYVKGNMPLNVFMRMQPKRAFKPTGLKMTYALLCNPDLINKPYRHIAKVADVALGTVGWIIRDLRELGFLVEMGKRGKKLIHKENLFNRWCTEYAEKLRPKLFLGKFKGPNDWWKNRNLNPDFAQWGGEVAAHKLTKYIKPQNILIYTIRHQYNNLITENRLIKDEKGETEILERFWGFNKIDEFNDIVHPVLVYADLTATGNQRNIETAKMIYEQYIVRYIREN